MKAMTVGKTVTAVAVGVCVLAASARANTIYELGSVDPGSPAGPLSVETGYASSLVTGYNAGMTSWTASGYVYTINKGSSVPAPLLPAVGFNNGQVNGSGLITQSINLGAGGYAYALVKWADIDEIYYIAGLTGTITINNDVNGTGGSSHYDLFSGGDTRIPDGGMTLALLGTSLCGLGLFARRRK